MSLWHGIQKRQFYCDKLPKLADAVGVPFSLHHSFFYK